MKLILSRKGFDTTPANGNGPSPIIDGTQLFPLPIPFKKEKKRRFRDLRLGRRSLGDLIPQLHPHLKGDHTCHLDPDLRRELLPRDPRWRPVFGQADQAATHLVNQNVGRGDLFLFFGLFRESE